jgi:hypothetical protein
MRLRSFLFGAAVGAAAAFLLDPDRGRGRRARIADQGEAFVRRTQRRAAGRGRYAVSAAVGRLRGAASRIASTRPVDDATVADRVRSEALGDSRIPAGEINVDVADGLATLRGELKNRALIREIAERVRVVPGVLGVRNLLHTPADEPAANKRAALRASDRAAATTPPTGEAIE